MKHKKGLESPMINGTMPHQISSPSFNDSTIQPQDPFINKHGVIIGDSLYDSPQSPINNWSKDVDPEIMAGDEWVHPTNDIGWNTEENNELLHGTKPKGVPFMHPTKDTSYPTD